MPDPTPVPTPTPVLVPVPADQLEPIAELVVDKLLHLLLQAIFAKLQARLGK